MASKRKEVLSGLAAFHAKRAKKDPQSHKLSKQLREVVVALNTAPITPAVASLLESVLPLTLGEFYDQRHRYQEEVVGAVASILSEAEATLNKEVVDARSQRDLLAGQKTEHEKTSEDAAGKLKVKMDEVYRLKVVLAEKAMAFRAATQSLTEAEEAKRVDGKKAQEAEKKKGDFEGCLENLNVLKTILPEDAADTQMVDKLLAFLKKHKFEESMLVALPAALAKAPDARGQFDHLAMNELEGELSKLIAAQSEIISAATPTQEKCKAAVQEAQSHLAAVRAEQRTAARSFDVASEEQSACEATATATQKALRELNQLLRKLEASLNSAEAEVEVFVQGPRATFKELRQRSTPAPAEEEEVTGPDPTEVPVAVA